MNNKEILKRKLENYLLRPMFASLFLIVMCVALFFVDKKCGFIACAIALVTILAEFIIYFVSKASIMPTLMRFALEQGQIQKELLNQLAVPYALLDTDGKILWGNKQFVDRIGGGSKKRIRKNIGMFFPQLASGFVNEVS